MPIMKKIEEDKLYLPTTEKETNEDDRGFVMLRKKLVAGDLVTMSDESVNAFDRAVNMMALLVTDWNFFQEDGVTKVPITVESLRHLEIEDFTFLSLEIAKIAEESDKGLETEEKKTSTVTLTPPSPVTNPA